MAGRQRSHRRTMPPLPQSLPRHRSTPAVLPSSGHGQLHAHPPALPRSSAPRPRPASVRVQSSLEVVSARELEPANSPLHHTLPTRRRSSSPGSSSYQLLPPISATAGMVGEHCSGNASDSGLSMATGLLASLALPTSSPALSLDMPLWAAEIVSALETADLAHVNDAASAQSRLASARALCSQLETLGRGSANQLRLAFAIRRVVQNACVVIDSDLEEGAFPAGSPPPDVAEPVEAVEEQVLPLPVVPDANSGLAMEEGQGARPPPLDPAPGLTTPSLPSNCAIHLPSVKTWSLDRTGETSPAFGAPRGERRLARVAASGEALSASPPNSRRSSGDSSAFPASSQGGSSRRRSSGSLLQVPGILRSSTSTPSTTDTDTRSCSDASTVRQVSFREPASSDHALPAFPRLDATQRVSRSRARACVHDLMKRNLLTPRAGLKLRLLMLSEGADRAEKACPWVFTGPEGWLPVVTVGAGEEEASFLGCRANAITRKTFRLPGTSQVWTLAGEACDAAESEAVVLTARLLLMERTLLAGFQRYYAAALACDHVVSVYLKPRRSSRCPSDFGCTVVVRADIGAGMTFKALHRISVWEKPSKCEASYTLHSYGCFVAKGSELDVAATATHASQRSNRIESSSQHLIHIGELVETAENQLLGTLQVGLSDSAVLGPLLPSAVCVQ